MKNIIFILMIIFSAEAIAQNTITISTGEWWKDALLLYHAGDPNLADNNYKNYSGISAVAWTASGTNTFYRTLMYFNLDTIIPSGSTINSATLYLYSDPTITSSPSCS